MYDIKEFGGDIMHQSPYVLILESQTKFVMLLTFLSLQSSEI
jgi:hypothetical protein